MFIIFSSMYVWDSSSFFWSPLMARILCHFLYAMDEHYTLYTQIGTKELMAMNSRVGAYTTTIFSSPVSYPWQLK